MIKAFRFMCDTLPRSQVILPATDRAQQLTAGLGPPMRRMMVDLFKMEW